MRILFLALALFTTNALALTKSEALELSKSRIHALLPHYAQLAYTCFVFETECQIEGNSQEATLKWLSWELRENPPVVEFDSGREKFFLDGAVRIAKTGSHWGTPVIFNEDLLVTESNGSFEALGLFEILGVLIHEFGHHQELELRKFGLPVLEHHELDLLAVRVVDYLRDRTRRLTLTPREAPGLKGEVHIYQIDIEWYNGIRNVWSRIFVDSLAETREISAPLIQNLKCPRVQRDGRDVFRGVPYFAAFKQLKAPKIRAEGNRVVLEQEVGSASALCADDVMNEFRVFDGYTNGRLRLEFTGESGLFRLSDGASSFQATPPPDEIYR